MKKKTILNVLLMLFILSFFVTPLGHYGKLLLTDIFSFSPRITPIEERTTISDYDWKLKDSNWDFFNFERSKGKVILVNFWASWKLPSEVELKSLENLYEDYGDRVDFYFITNEEREPVIEFMKKKDFNFPLTYLIIGEKMPLDATEVPATYVISKTGEIAVHKIGVANWDTSKVRDMLDGLLTE